MTRHLQDIISLQASTYKWLNSIKLLNSVTNKKSPNVYKSGPKTISLEKWKFLKPLQKLNKNVSNLGKIIELLPQASWKKPTKKTFKILTKVAKFRQICSSNMDALNLFRLFLFSAESQFECCSRVGWPGWSSRCRRTNADDGRSYDDADVGCRQKRRQERRFNGWASNAKH